MSLTKSLTVALTAAAILSACGGGAGPPAPATDSVNPITALEAAGKLPKLDSSANLLGVDSDNNGVRDDIDNYINKMFDLPPEKLAVYQIARSRQSIMILVESGKINDPVEIKAVKVQGSRAVHCIFDVMGIETPRAFQVTETIQKMTFNTKQRAKAYLDFNSALSGTNWATPVGDTCE
ncbi:hypothetical protein [Diaphorobacter sp. LR2014-1]|uniref:hypothetical protein n=1 Tax=Diaphorobacter sp. LR2014-1 TaxID=1933219 RepID=UPI0011AF5972|nr:hypothetical protein [Diaphorobacter sp. LR2014-1]